MKEIIVGILVVVGFYSTVIAVGYTISVLINLYAKINKPFKFDIAEANVNGFFGCLGVCFLGLFLYLMHDLGARILG